MSGVSGFNFDVRECRKGEYEWLLLNHHYAKRVPSVSYAYGIYCNGDIIGVVTFGNPASRHLQVGACRENPDAVIELNRLCVIDSAPKNTESWFLSRALKMLPPRIVVSYADTVQGHFGYVYRASNFNYAGWTDMDRKTPRYDYLVPGKHSRAAFRSGDPQFVTKVRRKPKVRYWTVTGDRKTKNMLSKMCTWPTMCWLKNPPPKEHVPMAANDNDSLS